MDFNVNYKEGDIYNNRIVTQISVSRQMNPKRKNRLGHYIYWKNIKNNKSGRCNFTMFGRNAPRINVIPGVNDIATVAPWMITWFKDPTIPYTHTVTSKHMVDWICPYCQTEIKNKTISNFYYYGKVVCPNCSDGISYPERFLSNLLTSLDIDFKFHEDFIWSNERIYDFYIPSIDCIIETHGKQHYTNSWSSGVDKMRDTTIQENDIYKYKLAKENGISNYVVLDCQISDAQYIMNNILKSELIKFYDFSNVNWTDIGTKSLTSVFTNAINLLLEGVSGYDILDRCKISSYTLNRYVKRAKKIGMIPVDFKYPVKWNKNQQIRTPEKKKPFATYSLYNSNILISLRKKDVELCRILLSTNNMKEYAKIMGINYDTLKYRIRSLYNKFNVHSKKELIQLYNSDYNFSKIIDSSL